MVIREERSIAVDIESGPHRTSAGAATGETDGSACFSDAEDRSSWHSPYYEFRRSSSGGDGADHDELCRSNSCISDCSSDDGADLEKSEKDCRICHLSLESNAPESGVAIVLGCSCKDDLAAAHKQCAETWFKIKGNKTCEICGSTAKNVLGAGETELAEISTEASSNGAAAAAAQPTETQSFWRGHRFLNFLLACVICAFVISWLFHFNVPG